MLDEIRHTLGHFNGVVKEEQQWCIPGFCIPLELLAFKTILKLGSKFMEIVPSVDKKCPRMCKNRFKKTEFRGWPFCVIVEELGDTKDIDSIIVVVDKEEDVLLAQITEEDDDVDKHDIVIESWMKRLGAGDKVFFEDMLKEDIASRS